jgi:hypothetical protein
MNTKFILPKEFHDFIEKRNFKALSDCHYFKHQIICPEIVEKYGELTDDGYFELTKRGGGELRFDQVYGYEWVIEGNEHYRHPEIYNTIPAYSINTIVDELLKYGIYVYVDLTEDGFIGRVTTFIKNINPTQGTDDDDEDIVKNFSFTSGINSTDKAYDNMYDAYKDIIEYTIKSYKWDLMTKNKNK